MRKTLLAIFTLSLFTSCVTINQGMVGVKRQRGIIDPQVLYEGRESINPFKRLHEFGEKLYLEKIKESKVVMVLQLEKALVHTPRAN